MLPASAQPNPFTRRRSQRRLRYGYRPLTRYRFELAQPSDDEALRRLMADTPMPGDVTLAFEREPNFFLGNRVLGVNRQTIVCRDSSRDELVGLATRSSRLLYVNGQPKRIGYLGGLRFAKHVRGAGLLARGFRFLRELHEADSDPPEHYLTTIVSGNEIAKRALTSRRAGLPTYHPLGSLSTFVVACRSLRGKSFAAASTGDADMTISSLADEPSIEPWRAFINAIGRRRTYFPAYSEADFHHQTGVFHDLDFASILLVKRGGRIVATAGAWNQASFRQTVVRDYTRLVRVARPLLNAWARLAGNVTLPPAGTSLSAAYISLLVIRDDDPMLLRTLLCELADRCDTDALLVGRCDGDPLLTCCQEMSGLRYRADLYAVNWNGDAGLLSCQRKDASYLELGCL